ncbi:inter alpha-trypsin inhibitor, heavy chain 4-like isoform X2 [Ptychodera flava]|uniref:inter alpha-trypsin inhibitor, heavy chain 4-like isoform X2 n=1 Tax=Ptychodera flava TaxID=63121 RepID=UPI00396A34EE
MDSLLVLVVLQFLIASAVVDVRISGASLGKSIRLPRGARDDNVVIRKFHVTSRITSRFASTEVLSVVKNGGSSSSEVVFEMMIPETAFTTDFTAEIGNDTYSGKVQEKKQARRTYSAARKRGQTAGHVAVRPRVQATDIFRVSMNVEAGAKAHFVLTYQEMLFRRRGIYEHRISIRPLQVIDDLKVEVVINEPQGITFIQAPPIQSNRIDRWISNDVANPLASIERRSSEHARIVFNPSREEQIAMSSNGIKGDFVVRYDVTHEFNAGELQVLGSYFVHHFAPVGLKPARKNVVFAIDVSGSMGRQKMDQTKSALKQILGDMKKNDQFNIVTFSGIVNIWKSQLVPGSEDFLQQADEFVDNLHASGATDINGALLMAVDILNSHHSNEVNYLEKTASMVILLTDGNPTSGVSNFRTIQENVKSAVNGRYSIFCLGFGYDVDYAALEKLALQNNGVARKIFVDADASLQLKGFYDEVANPILFNLDINYPGDIVDKNSITKSNFPVFYDGSEIVVAGKLKNVPNVMLQTQVTAFSFNDSVELETQVSLQQESIVGSDIELRKDTVADVTQRFWVYLTIKQVLDQMKVTSDENVRNELKQRVVDLSVEYNFVTELTSFVVVADDDYQSREPATTISPTEDLDGSYLIFTRGSYLRGAATYLPPTTWPPMTGAGFTTWPPTSNAGRWAAHWHGYTTWPLITWQLTTNAGSTTWPSTSNTASTTWPRTSDAGMLSTQRPSTTQPSSPTTQDPYFQLSDVYFGAFSGKCDVGVKLRSMDQVTCFKVPNDFINVNYSLFEIPDGLNVKGSFERVSNNSAPKCLKSEVVINNIQNDVAMNRTDFPHGSELCDTIHISLSEKSGRQIIGLTARLVLRVPPEGVQSYDIEEIDGVKLRILSSQEGHFDESLFEPL